MRRTLVRTMLSSPILLAALIPDSAGRLWVGTGAGLALMDCDRGTFEHLHNSLEENSEPHDPGHGR